MNYSTYVILSIHPCHSHYPPQTPLNTPIRLFALKQSRVFWVGVRMFRVFRANRVIGVFRVDRVFRVFRVDRVDRVDRFDEGLLPSWLIINDK